MKNELKNVEWIGRIVLAIVFFWFGVLKIFGVSPASDLVKNLLDMTMPFIPFGGFLIFLGVWEALIGLLYLWQKTTKIAFWLMLVQMATTFGPMILLPELTWNGVFVPSLEGQYIIKNLALIALGYSVFTISKVSKQK